jgi:DNA-binding PadR family transcriptional regulator
MQEPTFLILTALAAGPVHGYGVIQAVKELSGGEVVLRPGTLYGALDRLAEQGFIAVDHEEAVDGRLRRYYRLSDDGAAALAVQVDRLRRHAAAAERNLQHHPGIVPGFGGAA